MRLDKEESKKYLKEIRQDMPASKHISTVFRAFLTGGIICCIGQGISDIYKNFLLKGAEEDTIAGLTTLTVILITGILTGLGVYDKIGNFGGAGSIVPITGFANSVVSPAIEHKREGVILGLCSNMFTIAGPVIVFGISASVIVGIIYLFV